MKIVNRIVILASIAACSTVAVCAAAEEKVAVASSRPTAVQAAVKKLVGTAKVSGFTKETEDGKTTYEVEYKAGDVDRSATFAADGKVTEEEEDVKASDLPAAVSAVIAKAAPGGKVGDVSKVKADDKSYYEADVTVGEEKHEIKLAADGTVLSNKIEKDEDDEKDEHKGSPAGKK